jgi:hypothetical protein
MAESKVNKHVAKKMGQQVPLIIEEAHKRLNIKPLES